MTDEVKQPSEMKFDPSDLITFKFTNKDTGAVTETKMLKGTKAMNWFYAEHPLGEGRIITEIVQIDPPVIRAEIWIKDVKAATGHANIEKNCNTLKRVESVAIRRALANAGYGTDQIIKRIAEGIGVDRTKELLGSGKDKGERKMGGNTTADTVGEAVGTLKTRALKEIFNNDIPAMNRCISQLMSEGKLPLAMTINAALEVIKAANCPQDIEASSAAPPRMIDCPVNLLEPGDIVYQVIKSSGTGPSESRYEILKNSGKVGNAIRLQIKKLPDGTSQTVEWTGTQTLCDGPKVRVHATDPGLCLPGRNGGKPVWNGQLAVMGS